MGEFLGDNSVALAWAGWILKRKKCAMTWIGWAYENRTLSLAHRSIKQPELEILMGSGDSEVKEPTTKLFGKTYLVRHF